MQLKEENLVQLSKDDLSYERDADKIDPLSRYVNDEDIWAWKLWQIISIIVFKIEYFS